MVQRLLLSFVVLLVFPIMLSVPCIAHTFSFLFSFFTSVSELSSFSHSFFCM